MATKTCKHIYALHTSNEDGAKSKRAIFCCDLRHGFRVKQWRCVGLGHVDCPLTAQQPRVPDGGESQSDSAGGVSKVRLESVE